MILFKIEGRITNMVEEGDERNITDYSNEETAESNLEIELVRRVFGEGVNQLTDFAYRSSQITHC